jgi:DNA-binding NtrC family response regulator
MPRKKNVLVIDDDRLFCHALKDVLVRDALEVTLAHTLADGLVACSKGPLDVVVLDQQLPDGESPRICPVIMAEHETAKIIFITAYPSFESAVHALRGGAYDYLAKPFDVEELRLAIARALQVADLERAKRLGEYTRRGDIDRSALVGAARGLKEVDHLAELAANTDAPVLLTGETGTGKGLVARQIHIRGTRADEPFVTLNCAALPETLIEAELFGWERGAFTGSVASREGLLEMAEGGTLFLDEIGDMPLHLQTKLLSIFEEGEVRRLGGRRAKPVDVRLLAATNASLEASVERGQFRADLYYRLNVLRIHLPPLRERTEDIPLLCEHFLARLAGRDGVRSLSDGEMRALTRYAWPGNVRELRNVLERACLLHSGNPQPSALLEVGPHRKAAPGKAETDERRPNGSIAPLEVVEREHLARALAHHQGNLSRTARALGIALSTLKRKIRTLGLDEAC